MSTENTEFSDYTFDLIISSTVEEETSWQFTQSVMVTYVSLPVVETEEEVVDTEEEVFNPETLLTSEEPPKFDQSSIKDDTLQMEKQSEETGELSFTPISLSCDLNSWEKSLPSIADETSDRTFSVTVTLGKASEFLKYSQTERTLKLIPTEAKVEKKLQSTVKIDVKTSTGRFRRYELLVNYAC